jgi:hypothetical protein
MRRWAAVTVGLYLVVASFLVIPPVLFFAGEDRESIWVVFTWLLPALCLVQAVLLVIPVKVAGERPVARRTVVASAAVGAIPMALLALAFVYCVLLMFLGEDGVDPFFRPYYTLVGVLGIWAFWSWFFLRVASSGGPETITRRMTRWLLTGSILELLVAIPAHILSRRREECCAPGFTLVGLAMGLAVAILAFGPAFFLLLVRRMGEKRVARG